MANEYQLFIESSVRGYHAYNDATVYIGEMLECKLELNNAHNEYAVVVKKQSGENVGHVPIELSQAFHKFIADYGEIEAECIGDRFNAGNPS